MFITVCSSLYDKRLNKVKKSSTFRKSSDFISYRIFLYNNAVEFGNEQ